MMVVRNKVFVALNVAIFFLCRKIFSQSLTFFHVTENYQDKFLIFDEYKINENSNQILSAKYGEWNPVDGLSMYEENIWKRRANLKGHQFSYAIYLQ